MADITGTHELGPGAGRVLVRTGRVIEFDATVEVKNEEPRNGGG